MNFLLHNRIEISNGKESVYFYNQMLKSVLTQLSLKKSYNDYLAIGTGQDNSSVSSTYKLNSYLKSYKLNCEYLQDEIGCGTLYIKKSVIIDDASLDGIVLTEAGLTDNSNSNPTIFNYFQFTDGNQNVGIEKQRNVPLVISVYIYLEISKSPNYYGLLTDGHNKFIDFLLGNGLEDDIYCARGNILIGNTSSISREIVSSTRYECDMQITISNNSLEISFSGNLCNSPATEVIMMVGNSPFARILTISNSDVSIENDNFSVKSNKVIEVGKDVSSIVSVVNNSTNIAEQSYFVGKYATHFGDKVSTPFYNLFDSNTIRFISKDGKMIFFVVDDKVYGFKNDNYTLTKLDTSDIQIKNILNIVSFGNFIFVVSKAQPYLYAYLLSNNKFSSCEIDFDNFNNSSVISNILKCDITFANNGKLLFGVIDKTNKYGWTFYFDYDSSNNKFTYDDYLCSQFSYTYVLGMLKNNYTDSMMIFLKANELAFQCKIIYHYSDKTYQDIYSSIAYYLTCDTKEIYTSDRAIIVEKLSDSSIEYYIYPNPTKIELSISGNEVDDYISANLKYLAQKFDDGSFKFFNLLGYNTPTEFSGGLPSYIDESKVLDFVFLNDVLLVFMNDESEKIIVISLCEDSVFIENVSSNNDTYNITYNKYNVVGSDNKNVVANFVIRMIV